MPTLAGITDSAGNEEYTVARLSRDNLCDIAKLHLEVYGASKNSDYFSKKYDTAYTGIENTGYIAYDRKDRPVAYYGVIPCFIQYGNEKILAAQSADTMTHPEHRYKGMFAKLSNLTFDLCRTVGIQLVFGFPNQNFYSAIINRSAWRTIDTMDCFTIPVTSLQSFFQKLYRKLSLEHPSTLLKKDLLPLNGVANSVFADGFAGVCRDKEYMDYKTYNDSKVIGIDDSKIWISERHGMVIGDMEAVNETNFIAVISKLEKIANKQGLGQLEFHSSPGTRLHQLFAANYQPRPSFHVILQDFGSAIPPEKIKFTFADIDIF